MLTSVLLSAAGPASFNLKHVTDFIEALDHPLECFFEYVAPFPVVRDERPGADLLLCGRRTRGQQGSYRARPSHAAPAILVQRAAAPTVAIGHFNS